MSAPGEGSEADRLTLEVVKAARAHVFTCKRDGCHDDIKAALVAYGHGRTATPKRRRWRAKRDRGDGLDGRRGLVDMGVAPPEPTGWDEAGPAPDYDG